MTKEEFLANHFMNLGTGKSYVKFNGEWIPAAHFHRRTGVNLEQWCRGQIDGLNNKCSNPGCNNLTDWKGIGQGFYKDFCSIRCSSLVQMNTPEAKERSSKTIKEALSKLWKDPQYIAKMKALNEDPEYLANRSFAAIQAREVKSQDLEWVKRTQSLAQCMSGLYGDRSENCVVYIGTGSDLFKVGVSHNSVEARANRVGFTVLATRKLPKNLAYCLEFLIKMETTLVPNDLTNWTEWRAMEDLDKAMDLLELPEDQLSETYLRMISK